MNTDARMTEFKFKNLHFHPPEFVEIEKFEICKKINRISETRDDLTADQMLETALEGASEEAVKAVRASKKAVVAHIRRKKKISDMELLQMRKRAAQQPLMTSTSKPKRGKMFIKDELKLTHTFQGRDGHRLAILGVGYPFELTPNIKFFKKFTFGDTLMKISNCGNRIMKIAKKFAKIT